MDGLEFANRLTERTGKGYVSYSALKYAANGSRDQDMKLFELYMKGLLKKESDALYFGSVYDMLLLEPEKFNEQFTIIDTADRLAELNEAKTRMDIECSNYKNPRASKKWKEAIAPLQAEYDRWYKEQTLGVPDGVKIVPIEMKEQADAMIKRLDGSEIVDPETGEIRSVRSFLEGTPQKEISSWIGDVPVRGFLDVRGEGDFITDSKTTRGLHGFRYDVDKYCYDIQAYIYTEVEGVKDFYWVAQSKSIPYTCAVYKASDRTLERGKQKFWSAVENVQNWLTSSKGTETFAIYSEI